MDQATQVEIQIEDGQSVIDRLSREGIAVTAANWVKESESGQWYLYLATPLVSEDGGTTPSYRRVNAVIRELQKEAIGDLKKKPFGIDSLEVKVIGPPNPIAKAVASIRDRQDRIGPWFRGDRLGNVSVEGAYMYPLKRIFVFKYRRRGQTTHWDAVSPGHCVRCDPEDLWTDGETRFEQPEHNTVVIRVYSEEALEEEDATPAEELANKEFKKHFPEHTIVYQPDEETP